MNSKWISHARCSTATASASSAREPDAVVATGRPVVTPGAAVVATGRRVATAVQDREAVECVLVGVRAEAPEGTHDVEARARQRRVVLSPRSGDQQAGRL